MKTTAAQQGDRLDQVENAIQEQQKAAEQRSDKEQKKLEAEIDRDQNQMLEEINHIRNFGNGVYYFPQIGDDFRKRVSTFLSFHTNLEVACSDGDVVLQQRPGYEPRCDYGATVGHTVFFREKR